MRTIRTLLGCCTLLAAAVSTGGAFAEEEAEGVALVSHCVSDGCDFGSACADCCDAGCDSDASCDGCARCGQGHRCRLFGKHHHCSNDCRTCGDGSCGNCRRARLKRLFCGPHYAPGHGYVLPTKRPMWDVAYPYGNMLNATAMGMANGQQSSSAYGNVYMPTDTTQLGYSYGHVPYWMPRAGMVPPVPHPESYHLRVCLPGYRDGHCQHCQTGYSYGHGGTVISSTPSEQLHEVASEPTLAPIPN